MRFRVQDSRFRVSRYWYGVFEVQGFCTGFRVRGCGNRVRGSGMGFRCSGFRVVVVVVRGCGGLGFRVRGLGYAVRGTGFWWFGVSGSVLHGSG